MYLTLPSDQAPQCTTDNFTLEVILTTDDFTLEVVLTTDNFTLKVVLIKARIDGLWF